MALNGRLPDSDLGTIEGTSRKVLKGLVPQTNALRAAFKEGTGKPLVITDGYRTYDQQVITKALKGNLAATPGTSNHGWGKALDLGSGVNSFGTPEYKWMKANAPRFGWYHPSWAEPTGSKPEPWHWEANAIPVPVTNYTDIIPEVNIPNPTGVLPGKLEEDVALTEKDKIEIASLAADLTTTKIINYLLINNETLGGSLAGIRNDLIIALNEIASTRRDVQGADAGEVARDAIRDNKPVAVDSVSTEVLAELARAVNDELARRMGS